ncbi:AraC family transcriptional regulator [Paenibacillus sp. GCM10027626]|uniref:helix-turn-helix transcriptional regulator n=1 Tax=Paenibacillus sp. GCM10027626 TaxID=3273411 RepID=UPI0036332782
MGGRKPEEYLSLLDVTSAYAGTVIYGPGGTFGPRVQQDLQLVLLHTGAMIVEINGEKHNVPCGHVALLKPGRNEHFFFDPNRETWHRWIAVSAGEIDPVLMLQLDHLPFSIPISDKMNMLTDLMYSHLGSGGSSAGELMAALGKSALLLYTHECERMNENEAKHPAVIQAKDIIHRQFADELSLNDIARAIRKTPEHLIRLFHRDEALTPMQYLWQYRVKQGIALLKSTGLNIGEVAEQAGFKTSYHFARTIKHHTGQTPSEIRRESYH